jgi:hypothetical protein
MELSTGRGVYKFELFSAADATKDRLADSED